MSKDLGKSSTGIQPNVAALLSYAAGFISGIIFIVIEKDNKFVKFHAMQSIVTFGALCVLQIACSILGFLAFLIPILQIVSFILWIILMIKAYQGEIFKLPVAGDIAEKQLSLEKG